MREIMFRVFAYTDNGNQMVYLTKFDCDNGLWFPSSEHIDDYRENIMQNTGLRDVKENWIYEGDILKEKAGRGNKYKVFAVPGGFAINTFQDDLKKSRVLFFDSLADMQNASYVQGNCEIIGNIFEHPELLS